MADFCSQCSKELFGEDTKDLAGYLSEHDSASGDYAIVYCGGCGLTKVDYSGKCIDSYCKKQHGVAKQ